MALVQLGLVTLRWHFHSGPHSLTCLMESSQTGNSNAPCGDGKWDCVKMFSQKIVGKQCNPEFTGSKSESKSHLKALYERKPNTIPRASTMGTGEEQTPFHVRIALQTHTQREWPTVRAIWGEWTEERERDRTERYRAGRGSGDHLWNVQLWDRDACRKTSFQLPDGEAQRGSKGEEQWTSNKYYKLQPEKHTKDIHRLWKYRTE